MGTASPACRTAARSFVADQHHLAGRNLAVEDTVHRRVLALEHAGGAREAKFEASTPAVFTMQPFGEVAEQHGEAAILRVGVRGVSDDAALPVEVEFVEADSWLNATGSARRPGAAR